MVIVQHGVIGNRFLAQLQHIWQYHSEFQVVMFNREVCQIGKMDPAQVEN